MLTANSSSLSAATLLHWMFGGERDGHFLVRLSGLISLLTGLLIFSLWIFVPSTIDRDFPSAAQVSPFTALGLMICGFNIRLFRWETIRRNASRIARLFRLSLLGIGLIGLAYHLGLAPAESWYFGSLGGRSLPMPSPITSACFLLFGAIFMLINRSRAIWLAHSLSLGAAMISFTGAIAAIYANPSDFPQWRLLFTEGPALPLLFIISLTLLSSSAYRSWTAVIVSDTDGGVMARRLLPASILVPVFIGSLRLLAERQGWINPGIGLTLHVLLSVLSMAMIVWWNAGMLVRTTLRGRQAAINNQDLECAYRETLRKSREIIFAFNCHGQLTFLNPAGELAFGVPAIPVIPLHVRDVFGEAAWLTLGPALMARCDKPLRNIVLETPVADSRFDLATSILFRSGNPFELLVIATPASTGSIETLDLAIREAEPVHAKKQADRLSIAYPPA